MKNSLLNLGRALNKAEQKNIFGGFFGAPCVCASSPTRIVNCDSTCPDGSAPYLANA